MTDKQRPTVVDIPVNELQPNEYNPNRQSDHDFELLCRSITEDGFTQPILAQSSTKIIIDGEHRWRAAKAIGMTTIPVVFKAMDEAEMRIATLRHNEARGNESFELAAEVLRDLDQLGASDWAADSLMLTDVESELFKQDFITSEYTDRQEATEPLTYEQVEQFRTKERKIEENKIARDKAQYTSEQDVYVLNLHFTHEEAEVIQAVLGKNRTATIIRLCRKALGHGTS